MYSKIDARFWDDEKVLALSLDGRYLMLYLLSTKHRNVLGCFQLPKAYAMEDTQLPEKRFSRAWCELVDSGIISYDEKVKILLVKNFLKYNPIENPNQVKGALTRLDSLPKSHLFFEVFNFIKGQTAAGGKKYLEPLIEALPKLLPERLMKPLQEPFEEPFDEPYTQPVISKQESESSTRKQKTPSQYPPQEYEADPAIDDVTAFPESDFEESDKSKPRRRKPSTLSKAQEVRFNRFWAIYPRKVSIGDAEKAWAKIKPDDTLTNCIIRAVEAAKTLDSRFRETRYTPHPATWLNGREWENQYESTQKGTSTDSQGHKSSSGFKPSVGFKKNLGLPETDDSEP